MQSSPRITDLAFDDVNIDKMWEHGMKQMKKREQELQNPDNWDWEHAEVHPGVRNPGAVVSVRFSGQEFEQIAARAEQVGKRLTDFIHDAALEKAGAPVRKGS